ncbi:MAG: FG-GAP-like repeat-containing protein [Candidatus Cloacimonetes bacterium]|nr:FG-GAP-like repeat-containing protein [Candidatus Cloacimonadota bacterium]
MKTMQTYLLLISLMIFTTLSAMNDMPLMAELQGEHNGSGFGYSMLSLDFNHDGYDDLVVLSLFYGYDYVQQTPSRGKVYIYYGGPGFSSATQPAMTLEGDYPEGMQRKVGLIVNVGDINGDGFDDLMIGDAIPNEYSSVRYMFYFGGTNDLSTPDLIYPFLPNESIYRFDKLGDVDGDGFDDIGLAYRFQAGIYSYDIQWGGSFNRQLVYSGSEIMPYLSYISGIGDINADGYHDFTIGYVSDDTEPPSCIIKFYYGNPDRSFNHPIVLINTQNAITRKCKPLGDINGDGYDDFFAYANYTGMAIWYGAVNLEFSYPDIVLNPVYFGNDSVRGIEASDINGDGFNDVIGASYSQQRLAVWLGSSQMDGHADWQKTSTLENYGYDLAVGDFNGDGYDDIAVSAPFEEGIWPYHDYRGYVFIYAGNPGMVANEDLHTPLLVEQIQLKLSPNPVRSGNTINIEIRKSADVKGKAAELQVFNIKGQLVYQEEDKAISADNATWSLNLNKLTNGVYLCRVKIGNLQTTKRFTIIK